jgi:hypothetical protein
MRSTVRNRYLSLMRLGTLLIGLAVLLPAEAPARPPSDVAELRRLDGAGERAWEKFRQPVRHCGLESDAEDGSIFNTFEASILSLDFAGENRRILPLLLTDKAAGDNLLNHKVRAACVLKIEKAGASYRIEVTSRVSPPGKTAILEVDAEGRLLNLESNESQFYVIGENSRASRLIDRFDFVKQRLRRFTCRLGETDAECRYQFLNYAERVFSDEIRHQSFWPHVDRRQHHAELDGAIRARIADPLILKLHRLIIANESATISPYQVWDAVLAGSGMSFGPHQWDIGINADAQRIFRELISIGGLQKLVPDPGRYFKSVRLFSTGDLEEFLLLVPKLNEVLQSPSGRDLILQEYIAWLEKDALSKAEASLAFLDRAKPEHRLMLLYYVDVDNQYGAEDMKASLRRRMEILSGKPATLAEIRASLDAEMMATPFAIANPDRAAARLTRTWDVLMAPD